MSCPRFLADNDLMDQIVVGVIRREPAVVMTRLRDVGLANVPDAAVLEYAASERFVVVSHDVNTMRSTVIARIENKQSMSGLFLIHQRAAIAQTIEDLILIGIASDDTEWTGKIEFLPL